jgi:hypothetical protein
MLGISDCPHDHDWPPQDFNIGIFHHMPGSSALPMLDPTPELPDDTLISRLQFATRIQNVLSGAGLRTVGEVREASDDMLLSLPDLGPASVTHLRETLGLPSTDGVRPR